MLNDEQSVKIIKEKINEILSRREFQKPKENNPLSDMIKRLWESIKEWIESILFKDGRPEREFSIVTESIPIWVQNVFRILLIVIAVIILFIVIKAVIRRVYFKIGKKGLSDPKAVDFLDNPGLAFERVKDLIAKKDYTNALRYLFICVLLKFHKSKVIHIEKWKTNRTYIREISVNAPEVSEQIRELSVIFNGCCYGNRTIDADCINRWFDFYKNLREKYESKD